MSIAVTLGEVSPFATRDDIVAAIIDENNRSDVDDSRVKRHLYEIEAELNRRLRLPDMETIGNIVMADGVGTLPTGFLAMRALYDADKCIIPAVDPMQYVEKQEYGSKVYALLGGQLRVAPDSDETVTAIYYKAIPHLTADQPSNWLLDKHPDIYVHGLNARFAKSLDDTDTAATEFSLFDRAVSQVEMAALGDRYGGPLQQRGTMRQTRGPRA